MSAPTPPRIAVFSNADALASLERADRGSPFQSAAWIEGWTRAHNAMAGLRSIELGVEGGTWYLPIEVVTSLGARLGRKIGGSHASVFVPLCLGSPRPLNRADLRAAAKALALDGFVLADCPTVWSGSTAFEPGFPAAPDIARGTPLSAEHLTRLYAGEPGKKLRAKARKLSGLGTLEARFVQGAEARDVLSLLLGWKAVQFRAMGVSDPFSAPEMVDFLREGISLGGPLRLFALFMDQRPIAGLVLAQAGKQASGMMTAYSPEAAVARFGPGDVLVMRLLEALTAEGVTAFDLGIGDARYKRLHAPEAIALMDVFIPATPKGAFAVHVHRLARAAKARIKRSSSLFDAIKALRARLKAPGTGRP